MIPAKEIDGELWIRAADARIKELAELRLQMDLRDYFAAKAMQGLLASPLCPSAFDPKQKAASAYAVADAMLKARDK
jgi:hypothetical protein